MNASEETIMEERRRALRTYWGLPARKTLLFVHPFDAVADCFVHALEQEYPWLSVKTAVGWHGVPTGFKDPVALVLVDSRLAGGVEAGLAQLRENQPGPPLAIVCDDLRDVSFQAGEFMPSDAMRGLLPMNMKLDLWLSIVGLMLHGGDYYPPALLKAMVGRTDVPPAPRLPVGLAAGAEGARRAQWKNLTEREQQVLASVARGTPNKLVAAELGLSEHTVKIHIHNIIRKLKVHNRTEAAALYLQATSQGRHRYDGES
ncbi:MAG: response regulator transcription factor [Methylobacterium mesophilicum]|nr:response regulator transcription factor [Methylobacterium mesophilicum]